MSDERAVHTVENFETDELTLQIKKGRSIYVSVIEDDAPEGEGSAGTFLGLDDMRNLRAWLDLAIAVLDGSDPGIPVYIHPDATDQVMNDPSVEKG